MLSESARKLIEASNATMAQGGHPAEAASRLGREEADRRAKTRRAGRAAREAGEAAEAMALRALDAYESQGTGRGEKFPTPYAFLSKPTKGGTFKGQLLGGAGADLVGLAAGGRYFRIEVKHTNQRSIRFDRVSEERQAPQLDGVLALGGLAAVLASLPSGWWLVPWSAWRSGRERFGRSSLGPEQMSEIAHSCEVRALHKSNGAPVFEKGRPVLWVDWMPGLLKMLN